MAAKAEPLAIHADEEANDDDGNGGVETSIDAHPSPTAPPSDFDTKLLHSETNTTVNDTLSTVDSIIPIAIQIEPINSDEARGAGLAPNEPDAQEQTQDSTEEQDQQQDSSEDDSVSQNNTGLGWFKGWLRDGHIKHTILYTILVLYLLIELFTIGKGNGFALVGFIIFYILFIVEVCFSSTRKYLGNISTTESTMDYMRRLYQTPPTLSIHMSCFHTETRTRLVSYRDSSGNYQSRTETYTVTVTTWTGSEPVNLARWQDGSVRLQYEDIEEYQITKVKLSKSYQGDELFELQKSNFINRNKHRDVSHHYSVKYDIVGYKTHVLTFVDLNKKSEYLSHTWFVIAHVSILPALPYRIWVSSITGKVKPNVHKIFQTHY